MNKEVARIWMEHYVDNNSGLCVLCCNTGTIKLPMRQSAAGNVFPAESVYCICPNGQELRGCKTNGTLRKPAKVK